jgi:hypothetical protein
MCGTQLHNKTVADGMSAGCGRTKALRCCAPAKYRNYVVFLSLRNDAMIDRSNQ